MSTQTPPSTAKKFSKKEPLILGLFLLILSLGSLYFILLAPTREEKYIADIYQNGKLLHSIPLYEIRDSYCFDIIGENGSVNTVEVSPGAIAIIAADCPDGICVHQGTIRSSLLPITCLPNRVVIQLRAIDPISLEPDGISY